MGAEISDEQHEHLVRVAQTKAILARQQAAVTEAVPELTVLELAEAYQEMALDLVKIEQKPEPAVEAESIIGQETTP
ncbi:unnamed protein product [marine sediment metagenome]|uniref:Uncharacterized protein n=1 Tax=marine sediment metagenome TaxID=412755 RepID=X0V488_9ZZZZ